MYYSEHSRNYIITGGPCTGKSTLINALRERGHKCYNEMARDIIREELDKGSAALPWIDIQAFSDLVFERMLELLSNVHSGDVSFFDRGIPDIMAYLSNKDLPIPDRYYDALNQNQFNKKVFFLAPWETIFQNDLERRESFNEAIYISKALKKKYEKIGFELVEVPFGTVEERVRFISENTPHLHY